ncbi:MAG: NADPH-dependent glutamate synthase [Clostridia bacterium]|nr:NADPH-dependent glutamate synthase [Clostridia bacterium]
MANMQKNKTPMREQLPEVRNKNWEEVACGYTPEEAMNEAARCLGCKDPLCRKGCPVSVRIPEFLSLVTKGEFAEAYRVIRSTNSLPAISGRVCPQETQCEGKCVRGLKGEPVAIGRLERFCADYAMAEGEASTCSGSCTSCTGCTASSDKIKVAVVGSGPAGLSCAGDLAARGYAVTVFEALHKAGGVLVYGIPEFRLPKDIVAKEIRSLEDQGVEIQTDMVIGKILSVDELFTLGYQAVFIASGAGLPKFMGIEGENANGVYSANEFLTRINLMKAYREDYGTPIRKGKAVAVVGGGNVAMDAARSAKRLGAEHVYIIYRRGEKEMPARREEIHHAKEEGIEFLLLTNPTKINTDETGNVSSITCIRMALGEPDASGRRSPIAVEGSEYDLTVDTVIIAMGTAPNPLIRMTTPGLETDKRGCFVTSDGTTTTREGVFAGGDAVTGAATVILAMGAGRDAAEKIDQYIKSKQ